MEKLKHHQYTSQFSEQIQAFIAEKRGLGCKYNTEVEILWEFDRFVLEHKFTGSVVTKDILEQWRMKRPNETEGSRMLRFGIVQRFSQHLAKTGLPSYVSNEVVSWHDKTFKAYIFTDDELGRFLTAVHQIPLSKDNQFRYSVIPALFTVLACTGIRIGEALNLKCENVVFQNQYVFLDVRNTKYNKDRRLPLAPELGSILQKYLNDLKQKLPGNEFLFPSPRGGQYNHCSIVFAFRKALRNAGIPYGGTGKGPRIHDIRHSFAVKSLRKLALGNADPQHALPFLSKYLGHKNLSSTQTYIQLTAELFPHITSNIEKYCGNIVPLAEVHHDKTN